MPMVVAQLEADLKADLQAIFEDLAPETTAESKAQQLADALAERIDAYIRGHRDDRSNRHERRRDGLPGRRWDGHGDGDRHWHRVAELMLATLGSLVFEASAELVRTFGDAALKTSARWEAHEVIGRKPVQEFVGPALRTLGFAVRLDARLGVDPEVEAAALPDSVEQGEILSFVLGGRPFGDWVAKELSETWRHVTADGRVQVIVVELSLEEYV